MKIGITDPLLPITLPYLTTENLKSFPTKLLAAINNLSDVSFDAHTNLLEKKLYPCLMQLLFLRCYTHMHQLHFARQVHLSLQLRRLYSAMGTCFNAVAYDKIN